MALNNDRKPHPCHTDWENQEGLIWRNDILNNTSYASGHDDDDDLGKTVER
jgi:hypothetical protein